MTETSARAKRTLAELHRLEQASKSRRADYGARARLLHDRMLAEENRLRKQLETLPDSKTRQQVQEAYLQAVAARSLAQTMCGNLPAP